MSSRQSLVVAGGLGSGKSTVAALLARHGWSIIDADEVGRQVLAEPEVVTAIATRWPQAMRSGFVNRAELARVVFADPGELAALEAITHPRIIDRVSRWLDGTPTPRGIEVSVLAVRQPSWGAILVVHAPESKRLRRVVERGMDEGDARRRMTAQLSEQELLAAADYVIDNTDGPDRLQASVERFEEWSRA
jgi:dephospho-CoA kinase